MSEGHMEKWCPQPNHNPDVKRSTAAWRDKEIDVTDAFRAWMIMLFTIGSESSTITCRRSFWRTEEQARLDKPANYPSDRGPVVECDHS
jgi:hypothetical protein